MIKKHRRGNMANFDKQSGKKNTMGVNSEESLLVIYILRILKKYSSPDKPMTSQDVMERLKEEYSIGDSDKKEAQQKKIRRHLDTLSDFYGKGCIVKIKGQTTRAGNRWFYDATKDEFAGEEKHTVETFSEVEVDFLIDIISSSKLLNASSTIGMIDKLLKKTKISEQARIQKLKLIIKEDWTKNINEELVDRKEKIEKIIEAGNNIEFDYNDKCNIVATPYALVFQDGKYVLKAKVKAEYSSFLLEKMHNIKPKGYAYEWDDEYFDEVMDIDFNENDKSNNITLENLFLNIPIIKSAIKEKRGIEFKYLSYAIHNDRVVLEGKDKRVLPHSLVFNDGKYYLIGIEEESSKIGYFRVDLISTLGYAKEKVKLSEWNERFFEEIKRAREVEKHPLMLAGKDIPVTFLVLESALDRVIDAFGRNISFKSTNEKKMVPIDSSKQKWYENHSLSEITKENLVKVFVRTTSEEAFRWALANADAVELIYPQEIRAKLMKSAAYAKNKYFATNDDIYFAEINRLRYEICNPKNETMDFSNINITKYTTYKEIDVARFKFKRTDLQDISFVADKEQLRSFYSFENPIKSYLPLSKAPNLQDVSIIFSEVESLDFVPNCRCLRSLTLGGTRVIDPSAIYQPLSPQLEYLKLFWGTEIDVEMFKKYNPKTKVIIGRKESEDRDNSINHRIDVDRRFTDYEYPLNVIDNILGLKYHKVSEKEIIEIKKRIIEDEAAFHAFECELYQRKDTGKILRALYYEGKSILEVACELKMTIAEVIEKNKVGYVNSVAFNQVREEFNLKYGDSGNVDSKDVEWFKQMLSDYRLEQNRNKYN